MLPARSRDVPSAAEEAELKAHAEHLQSHGYTILRGVLSDEEVAETRARLDLRIAAKMVARGLGERDGVPQTGAAIAAGGSTISIGGPENSAIIGFPGLLGAAPEVAELLIKPFLLNPRLLDLAEAIMGPYVQGDGFYAVGTPPPSYTGKPTGAVARSTLLAEAAGWHRDAYSQHSMWRSNPGWADDLAGGGKPFTPPLAMHMLCYLQVRASKLTVDLPRASVHAKRIPYHLATLAGYERPRRCADGGAWIPPVLLRGPPLDCRRGGGGARAGRSCGRRLRVPLRYAPLGLSQPRSRRRLALHADVLRCARGFPTPGRLHESAACQSLAGRGAGDRRPAGAAVFRRRCRSRGAAAPRGAPVACCDRGRAQAPSPGAVVCASFFCNGCTVPFKRV